MLEGGLYNIVFHEWPFKWISADVTAFHKCSVTSLSRIQTKAPGRLIAPSVMYPALVFTSRIEVNLEWPRPQGYWACSLFRQIWSCRISSKLWTRGIMWVLCSTRHTGYFDYMAAWPSPHWIMFALTMEAKCLGTVEGQEPIGCRVWKTVHIFEKQFSWTCQHSFWCHQGN